MKLRKILTVATIGLFATAFGGTVSDLTGVAQAQEPTLVNTDCAKCHRDVPRDIEEAGGAHKTAVTCEDCHEGHPPLVLEIIPACSKCHTGTPHYRLEGCLSCHRNPHRPLEITLGKNITAPCLTCHEGEGKQLKEFPSYHSTLSCTSCHEARHGNVPNCTNCHKPHAAAMVEADCHKCHQAHKPLAVSYAANIPSTDCAACHDKVFNTLTKSTAKHSKLACATCHEAEHGKIPQCGQCHKPHSPDMAADVCKNCHQAHSPAPATFGDMVASADCGACHDGVFKALSTSQTKHQDLSCVDCHGDKHGNLPQCNQCHEPHAKDMVQADCVSCHAAHKPLPVAYGEKVASKLCASCHEDAYRLLQASKAKHHDLSCATCHQEKHKMIPACQDCHGVPHPAKMLQQFPTCGTCHNIAHNLLK